MEQEEEEDVVAGRQEEGGVTRISNIRARSQSVGNATAK